MFAPDSSSLVVDTTAQIMFPEVLETAGFQNNPIEFFVPKPIIPQSLVDDLPSGSLPQYGRDVAGFVTVILNFGSLQPEVYSVYMNSPVYDRTQEERIFNSEFTEF
jgi:hypothetical protein